MTGPNAPDRAEALKEIIDNLEKSLAMARAAGMDRTVVWLEKALVEAHERTRDEEARGPGTDLGITKESDA